MGDIPNKKVNIYVRIGCSMPDYGGSKSGYVVLNQERLFQIRMWCAKSE